MALKKKNEKNYKHTCTDCIFPLIGKLQIKGVIQCMSMCYVMHLHLKFCDRLSKWFISRKYCHAHRHTHVRDYYCTLCCYTLVEVILTLFESRSFLQNYKVDILFVRFFLYQVDIFTWCLVLNYNDVKYVKNKGNGVNFFYLLTLWKFRESKRVNSGQISWFLTKLPTFYRVHHGQLLDFEFSNCWVFFSVFILKTSVHLVYTMILYFSTGLQWPYSQSQAGTPKQDPTIYRPENQSTEFMFQFLYYKKYIYQCPAKSFKNICHSYFFTKLVFHFLSFVLL